MKLSDNDKAKELWERYLAGTCTPEEQEFMEAWYDRVSKQKAPFRGKTDFAAIENEIYRKLPLVRPARRLGYSWEAAAALLLIGVSFGLYFLIVRPDSSGSPLRSEKSDILPGYNQATLTLGDGRTISLDSAQSGIIISNDDIKYNNGNLVQNVILPAPGTVLGSEGSGNGPHGTEGSLPTSLSLTTPKGGQYRVILEDGTKVWLNAQSTLKYPSRFSGKARIVEISGEAFFDIKEDKTKPFKVLSKGQEVDVLGTSFNVTAYADEEAIKTTLVTGAVQVSTLNQPTNQPMTNERLSPGQQTINSNGKIQVKNVDAETETAWRNGWFIFNHTELSSVMKQLERWYNVEVNYASLPSKQIVGEVARNVPLSEVLAALQAASGLKFKMIERRVTVEK